MDTILDIRDASHVPGMIIGGLIGCYVSPELSYDTNISKKEYVLVGCTNIFVRSASALVGAAIGYLVTPLVALASPFLISVWLYKRYST